MRLDLDIVFSIVVFHALFNTHSLAVTFKIYLPR